MQFQRVQMKSEILSIRPPEFGTTNVFSTRFERSSFPLRSRSQWRRRRKPKAESRKREEILAEVKETSRAKSI